jgi:hypothetical protein
MRTVVAYILMLYSPSRNSCDSLKCWYHLQNCMVSQPFRPQSSYSIILHLLKPLAFHHTSSNCFRHTKRLYVFTELH